MQKRTKILLGVGAFAIIAGWMLTTKNEVMESFVFPLKIKLGLAKYKTGGTAA